MSQKSTIPTLTQKYNDLHALVTLSYADKQEQEDVWQSIRKQLLEPDGRTIRSGIMQCFEHFLGTGKLLAHKDYTVQKAGTTSSSDIILAMLESGELKGPWSNVMVDSDEKSVYYRLFFERNPVV